MPHIRLAALALATTALVASGCGKSSGSSTRTASNASAAPSPIRIVSTAPTGPLSRAQLIAKADAVCGRISAKRNLLRFSSSLQFELLLPTLENYQQALFSELRRLTPPASMRHDWSQIVSDARNLEESIAKVKRYADSVKGQSGNPNTVKPWFAAFARARLRLQHTAMLNGMADCARY